MTLPFASRIPSSSNGKASACNAGDPGLIPGSGRSPGEGNGNPLQYIAWRIPWTEEPGGLQSMGSQRVGHDWATNTYTHPIYITYILIYGNRKILHFTIICTWRGMIHFSSVNWDFLEHDTLHHFHRQRFRERNFITESDSLSFLTISGKLLCIHTYIHTLHWLIHLSSFTHSPLIKPSSHLPRMNSMVFLPLALQQSNPIFRLLPGDTFSSIFKNYSLIPEKSITSGPNLPF